MFILQTLPFVKPVSRAFLQQARAFSSFIFIGRHFTRRSLEGQTENCPIPTDEKRCRKSRHLQFFRHSVKGRESCDGSNPDPPIKNYVNHFTPEAATICISPDFYPGVKLQSIFEFLHKTLAYESAIVGDRKKPSSGQRQPLCEQEISREEASLSENCCQW